MRKAICVLVVICAVGLNAWARPAAKKPKPVKAKTAQAKGGNAVQLKFITTSHLETFTSDLPAVLPMVVLNFQTQLTEKKGKIRYSLGAVTPVMMQKIADQAQILVENELKKAGWTIVSATSVAKSATYSSWSQSPDPSGEESEREFFTAGKGTTTFASKEMERIFVGGNRPLVGHGVVLGGWTAAGPIAKIGQELGAKVIFFRAVVNFANVMGEAPGLFSGEAWRGNTVLEIRYADMDVYPTTSDGAEPARITMEVPFTLKSDFVVNVQKDSNSRRTIVADPARYAKDTIFGLGYVVRGFTALSKPAPPPEKTAPPIKKPRPAKTKRRAKVSRPPIVSQ